MIEIIQLIKELGSAAIDLFWLPVAIWTAIALIAAVMLNYFKSLAAVYQYHFRVALLTALPVGIAAAPLIHGLLNSDTPSMASALIVIQNPIPVQVASTAQAGINWSDPAIWVGIATVLVGLIALMRVAKLLFNYTHLKGFIKQLKNKPAGQIDQNTAVYLSDAVETPCTFGRSEKSIVIPTDLQKQPEKYNMALQHELMHIQNNDYVINSFMQLIKALFYFHPSVHYLIHQADEYREIFCDTQVLSDAAISQKRYAGLLYELAPKPVFKRSAAVNMAVNPSTLKKRIQMMKKQTHLTPSLKKSVMIALLLGFTLTGFMACSDMTNDVLTVDEVKKVQQKAGNSSEMTYRFEAALWVLNGKVMDVQKKNVLDRVKTKYIKSINVLKGEAAVEAYGEAGKNGVIEIQVYNKEKALNDLKPKNHSGPPPPPQPSQGKTVYMAVENMPKLQNKKVFYTGMEYPKACKQSNGGTVYVQFVVTETGETTDFDVVKGINEACNKATLQYVRTHAEFTAGTQSGQPVNVRYTVPIRYK